MALSAAAAAAGQAAIGRPPSTCQPSQRQDRKNDLDQMEKCSFTALHRSIIVLWVGRIPGRGSYTLHLSIQKSIGQLVAGWRYERTCVKIHLYFVVRILSVLRRHSVGLNAISRPKLLQALIQFLPRPQIKLKLKSLPKINTLLQFLLLKHDQWDVPAD